jgi:hypothetical protein
MVNCEDMGNSFDISVERLAGRGVAEGSGECRVPSGRGLEERIPQGLKPDLSQVEMSNLKLRPPEDKEKPKSPDAKATSGAPERSGGERPQHKREVSGEEKKRRTNAETAEKVTGTFYLETFGCQMNEHDSEKVAGVLLARGYKQVESADAASVVLYNTCSIREKAAQKVFSRLGEWRPEGTGRSEERIPQGLKPGLSQVEMSDLKVRPPNKRRVDASIFLPEA